MIVQLTPDATPLLLLRVDQPSGELLELLFRPFAIRDVHDADENRIERGFGWREADGEQHHHALTVQLLEHGFALERRLPLGERQQLSRKYLPRFGCEHCVERRHQLVFAACAKQLQRGLVHVGDADLPVVAIRRFVPPQFVIGASLGSDRELENARDADYVGIGPVFSSGSKRDAGEATGIDGFKRLAALCNLPAVAIGGVTAERAPQVMAAGAAGVAAINAIFKGADPEAAARLIAAAIGM